MTAPDPLIARRNQIPRGIFYMVLSTVMFAGVNAIVKWEVALYPVGEVAFFRSAFAFFAVCGLILPRTGLAVLRTNRYREHLQRGLSQFGSMTCMFLAFRALSLGSAIAISFSAPLFTTLLSILILKEKVGLHRWSALIVGFIGVLVVTHPGAGTLTMGAFFALANAVLISSVAVAIRRMSATESTRRCRQRHRAILVDPLLVLGAALGGGAVQLFVADLGGDARLCDLGRRADREPARRLGDRRRLRPLHPVARDLAAAAPACPGPAGRRGRAGQACLKKRSALPAISFGRCSGFTSHFRKFSTVSGNWHSECG